MLNDDFGASYSIEKNFEKNSSNRDMQKGFRLQVAKQSR
jgi:hypothetical protein